MPTAAPTCCTICKRRNCTCSPGVKGPRPRPSAYRRGYNKRWQRVRARFLLGDPLCKHCSTSDHPVIATQVDHIKPHNGSKALFNDWNNLQALCHSCHSRKTMNEAKAGAAAGRGGVIL